MSNKIARNKQFKFNQLKTSFKRYFITGILVLFDSWKEVELNLTNISRMLPSMQCFQEDILKETQNSWNHDEEILDKTPATRETKQLCYTFII